MNNNNLTVYKSNAVIQAGYQLGLNEQRVVLACIGLVDSRKELLATDRFELSAKDFVTMFGVSEKNAYKALIEVAQTLFKRYVVIEKPFPDKPNINKLQTHWISSICYMETEGKIALMFAPDLIPYLSQLKGSFTRYDLKHIGNMTSTYGIRLYELLMQWKGTGKREIDIEWLKKQFELDASYERMDNLKRRVIDPAVKDINTHSNFNVSWEQRKTGRQVTHLIFTFAEKQPLKPEKPKRTAKPKEKMILGLPASEIEAAARAGESYEDTAARINRKKESKSTATAVPVLDLIAKTGLVQPQSAAPVSASIAESEAHRVSVIKHFVSKNKEKYLKEFKERGCVSIHGISGVVIEPDLKLAGLFD
ncbi:MAG: RepB family plasmid replication initiator protein [Methylococcales bacterium]